MSEKKNNLEHIAIIMDGNGRWAQKRNLPRSAGHKKGAEVVKEIAKEANNRGIRYLTLYAFSTENWNRPKEEVDTLMGLLRQYLKSDFSELHKKEAVNLTDGKRLGRVCDVVFTYPEGKVQGIVVPGGKGFRWGRAELFIDLKCVK